eukprot:g16031.t1
MLSRSPRVPVQWPSEMSLGDNVSSADGGAGEASVPTSFSVYAAAEQGHLSLMTSYLAGGGNADKRSKEGYSILHLAAMRNQEAMVELLLTNGANPDVHDNGEGLTPLMWAAQLGHAGVVTALLDGGADMEQEDREDLTALHWAARLGKERVVLVLLERGADVEAVDYDGNTPLIWATRGGHRACVGQLLDNGASTKTPDENGNTALHFSCQMGHAGITSDLLDDGALATAQDYWEFTPFHRACSQGHGDVLVELLRAREPGIKGGKRGDESKGRRLGSGRMARAWGGGGSGGSGSGSLAPAHGLPAEVVDIRNHFQATPLHRAAAKGHAEVVTMLLQNGADIDARDGFFYTPLHLACVNGAVACVEVLLLAGADPSPRAQGGVTPLIAARKPEVRELVKEALATRKGSLWEVEVEFDVSNRSTACGGSEQGDGEGGGGAGSEERSNSASSTIAADLAAAILAVRPSGGAAGGTDVGKGVDGRRESDTTWEGFRDVWDPEMRPSPGSGPLALATDAGKTASPRGRPMSRLPRDNESRRVGSSARPRRSSTGSMLEKIFNSSSGPCKPQEVNDEAAAVTATVRMESMSLAGAESSTEASSEPGDSQSQSSGAGAAVPMERDGTAPDAFEAAAEVPAVTPAQMIPETPLHLAPRRSPSPPRSPARAATIAAAVAEKTAETVALGLPQFVEAPLDNASESASASATTLPRVVSADGDVQAAPTDAVAASTGSLPAAGGALPPSGGANELAPAAPATGVGPLRGGVSGSGDTVGEAKAASATAAAAAAAALNIAPSAAVARGGGGGGSTRGGHKNDEPAAVAPARVRAKKRRAKSLPPSTRRDRRPRGPRPCLEGPAAVIKTLTLEDDDADDGEAWALSQWLHRATASVMATAAEVETIDLIFEALTSKEEWSKLLKAPLERAASKGNRGIVKQLVRAGAELGQALHEAIGGGHGEIATDLLESGASIDAKDTEGNTPIHVAAYEGETEIVRHLLLKGANEDKFEGGFRGTVVGAH